MTTETHLQSILNEVLKMEKTFDAAYQRVEKPLQGKSYEEGSAVLNEWWWIGHELAHMKWAIQRNIKQINELNKGNS